MSTYSSRLQPALQNLLRVVWFFHPRSLCTTTYISADVRRITLNASYTTISGERTELDIFCRVTCFTSDFLSFIDVELIWFFHGSLQLCSWREMLLITNGLSILNITAQCSVSWLFWFVSTSASDWLQRLVSEMTYNDPAHSLTVFSLIPVWFVMAILSVVINDWILLPCYMFVMFINYYYA